MEIERKFLVKVIPDISKIVPTSYKRYILKNKDGIEERIQKKGGRYEYEIKKEVSLLQRSNEKKEMNKEEFDELKQKAIGSIVRDSYEISKIPRVSIKVYRDRFEGLIRAEIEFNSEHEAHNYIKAAWMGREITKSPLGRDAKLITMSQESFLKELSETMSE